MLYLQGSGGIIMRYTIKWWRTGEKPIGIEYRSLGSAHEIEAALCDLLDTVKLRVIEIRNDAGDLVAHYPDAKLYRPQAR